MYTYIHKALSFSPQSYYHRLPYIDRSHCIAFELVSLNSIFPSPPPHNRMHLRVFLSIFFSSMNEKSRKKNFPMKMYNKEQKYFSPSRLWWHIFIECLVVWKEAGNMDGWEYKRWKWYKYKASTWLMNNFFYHQFNLHIQFHLSHSTHILIFIPISINVFINFLYISIQKNM